MFPRNKSGNLRGAPKGRKTKQIAELLAPYVHEAVEAILEALHHKDTRLSAAKELLDRVYGKPAQALEVSGKNGGPLIAVIKDA